MTLPTEDSTSRISGRSAVAHGIEDTRTHVIDKQEQQTEHIHAQIQRAVRKDILRVDSAFMMPCVPMAPISVSSSATVVVVSSAVEMAVFMRR